MLRIYRVGDNPPTRGQHNSPKPNGLKKLPTSGSTQRPLSVGKQTISQADFRPALALTSGGGSFSCGQD